MNDKAIKLFRTANEIAALAGVSKHTVRRDVARGLCPRPIRIGAREFWLLHSARTWIASRRSRTLGKPRKTIPDYLWSDQSLPEFATEADLSALLGSSARTTRTLVSSRDFPGPVKCPGGRVLWKTAEVVAWLQALRKSVERGR